MDKITLELTHEGLAIAAAAAILYGLQPCTGTKTRGEDGIDRAFYVYSAEGAKEALRKAKDTPAYYAALYAIEEAENIRKTPPTITKTLTNGKTLIFSADTPEETVKKMYYAALT